MTKAAKLAKAKGKAARAPRACPRLRIAVGDLVLGPGKIDLIDAIARTGSISGAGREMGMSYRRAWLHVDALNKMFGKPIIVSETGGARGGGATITEFGQRIAIAYRRADDRTRDAVRDEFAQFDIDIVAETSE